MASSYAQEKMDNFILEVPTYLNLRLGAGSRVLYPRSLLRTTADGKLLRSLSLVLLPVGRSSGSTEHSLGAPAVMLWVLMGWLSQHEAIPAFPQSSNIPLCWIYSQCTHAACAWPGSNPGLSISSAAGSCPIPGWASELCLQYTQEQRYHKDKTPLQFLLRSLAVKCMRTAI